MANATRTKHGRIIPADATRAVGLFNPDGVSGYVAVDVDHPRTLHTTRAGAIAEAVAFWEHRDATRPVQPPESLPPVSATVHRRVSSQAGLAAIRGSL